MSVERADTGEATAVVGEGSWSVADDSKCDADAVSEAACTSGDTGGGAAGTATAAAAAGCTGGGPEAVAGRSAAATDGPAATSQYEEIIEKGTAGCRPTVRCSTAAGERCQPSFSSGGCWHPPEHSSAQ